MIHLRDYQPPLVEELRAKIKVAKPHLAQNPNPHFDRMRAKAQGRKRYSNGKPCLKGHVGERMTANGRCCICMQIYKRKPENIARELLRAKKDRALNPEKAQARWKKRISQVRVRLDYSMRARLRGVLQAKYKSHTFDSIFGYSREELILHLERQFSKGMTWENYGKSGWHIDHIVPVSHFAYKNIHDESFKHCWELSNLRPLWASQNFKKSSSRDFLI